MTRVSLPSQRGLVGKIIDRFETRGYQLKALKLKQASEELLRTHYSDLTEKKFFPDLLAYMLSGPVTCMVWEGENAVAMGRQMLGATNPQVRCSIAVVPSPSLSSAARRDRRLAPPASSFRPAVAASPSQW